MNAITQLKIFAGLAPLLLVILPAWGAADHLESADELKNRENEIRLQMQVISRQLHVTCATCHNVNNFRSPEKPLYPIAKKHIELTQTLIDHGMNGKDGEAMADCYMCHRGKQKPDYKEKIDPMTKTEKDRVPEKKNEN